MNEVIVTRFLSALTSNKLVDSAPYKNGKGALVISDKIIPFSIQEKGFAVGGDSPVECYCPNPEASLVRVLSCKLFGVTDVKFKDKLYSSVNVYPKAVRSDGVLFSTADGREFLASSSNTRVTLGLYDILYSRNADSSVLMLPELLPSGSDVVSIASRKVSQYFVSPKNEILSSSLSLVTDEFVASGADVETFKRINAIYQDKSVVAEKAPTPDDLVAVASQAVLSNTANGYRMSASISLDGGLNYHLEEDVKPSFALVQSSVLAAGEAISDLERGIIFSNKTHLESVLNLRQDPKAVTEESSLSYSSENSPSQRVADFWGIPVMSSVKSFVWSY